MKVKLTDGTELEGTAEEINQFMKDKWPVVSYPIVKDYVPYIPYQPSYPTLPWVTYSGVAL